MRNFVMVSPNFWVGQTGRDLARAGTAAQLTALYLLSNPQANYTGLYRLPLIYIANDLNMSQDAVRAALVAIEKTGFAKYHERSEYVWIVESARHQLGELKANDNKVKYVNKEFAAIGKNCPFIAEYFAKYGASMHLKPHKDMPQAAQTAAKSGAVAQAAAVEFASTEVIEQGAAVEQLVPAALVVVATTREAARVKFYDSLSTFVHKRDVNGFETYSGNETVRRLVTFAEDVGHEEAINVIQLALEAHDYDVIDFDMYAREVIDI
ncbi:hypothetical protein [Caballeronia ptereochthonis]|uniref:Uncharacterized protein n=1 Tax=Caballeronia ptereochthonis TaxID=1777144 RepID=A0A158CUG3_9BURK|nr:hypothetical protein [Caballeronia ptereochthonis]SAK86023.1 hypothetical protein AWB83_04698 [Caballeronia ptereochthonis]